LLNSLIATMLQNPSLSYFYRRIRMQSTVPYSPQLLQQKGVVL
jgi:hypothetical protein